MNKDNSNFLKTLGYRFHVSRTTLKQLLNVFLSVCVRACVFICTINSFYHMTSRLRVK